MLPSFPMTPLLSRQLLFVTGKGGVGKTTVSLALALASAARGRRTIVCEMAAQARVARLFGHDEPSHGEEVRVDDDLWTVSIDPQRALEQWIASIVGRAPTALLARSHAFGYFVAAAPGAREIVTLTKAWELTQSHRWDKHLQGYDLVIVDAPATGHALGMLRTPASFAEIARVGPIAKQAARVRDFMAEPGCSGLVGVALPSEMPVSETLDLQGRLEAEVGRRLEAVVANGVLPRRFDDGTLDGLAAARDGDVDGALAAAARAARSESARAHDQDAQLARLRAGAGAPVVELPFVFEPELRLEDVTHLALALESALA
jgi:anion-transporting  ArsA/GET3 family ATPase